MFLFSFIKRLMTKVKRHSPFYVFVQYFSRGVDFYFFFLSETNAKYCGHRLMLKSLITKNASPVTSSTNILATLNDAEQ